MARLACALSGRHDGWHRTAGVAGRSARRSRGVGRRPTRAHPARVSTGDAGRAGRGPSVGARHRRRDPPTGGRHAGIRPGLRRRRSRRVRARRDIAHLAATSDRAGGVCRRRRHVSSTLARRLGRARPSRLPRVARRRRRGSWLVHRRGGGSPRAPQGPARVLCRRADRGLPHALPAVCGGTAPGADVASRLPPRVQHRRASVPTGRVAAVTGDVGDTTGDRAARTRRGRRRRFACHAVQWPVICARACAAAGPSGP